MDLLDVASEAHLLAADPTAPRESVRHWLFAMVDASKVNYSVTLWGSEAWIHRGKHGGQLLGFFHGLRDLGDNFSARIPAEATDDYS